MKAKRRSIWSVFLLSSFGLFGPSGLMAAGAAPNVTGAPSPSLGNELAQARFYAWGMVGTPGAVSPEEMSARDLATRWSGAQIARAIDAANPEGRLYLLCVLRRQHPTLYPKARSQAAFTSDQQVSVFSGNVLQKVPVDQVLRQIEAGNCEPLSWRS